MHRCYFKIYGSSCFQCRTALCEHVEDLRFVQSVRLRGEVLEAVLTKDAATYANQQGLSDLIRWAAYVAGYRVKKEEVSWDDNPWKFKPVIEVLGISAVILLLSWISRKLIGYNIMNVLPDTDSVLTKGSLILVGLLTSVHCLGMCGGISLSVATDWKSTILYNMSRVMSYTFIGWVIGMLGGLIQINQTVVGMITVIAAIVMLLIGLSMSGVISFSVRSLCRMERLAGRNAALVGFLNGFMPCASLQAVQLYSLTMGSAGNGALAMFLFGIGTLPVMLGVGLIKSIAGDKKIMIQKIAGVIIVFLAISMMSRGFVRMGIDASLMKKDLSSYQVAEMTDGE